jgi:transaldolase
LRARAINEAFARAGLVAHEIHEALVIQDICDAADLLQPVHAQTQGRDGFVSLEVSPHLARDAVGTHEATLTTLRARVTARCA